MICILNSVRISGIWRCKTYQLIQIAFGDAAVSQAPVFEWFHHLKYPSEVMSVGRNDGTSMYDLKESVSHPSKYCILVCQRFIIDNV
jgi:hypothetical protein